MPKKRDPRRDQAFEIYKKHNQQIDLIEIASQLNVPDGTVRGWKNKDKWNEKLNGTFRSQPKNEERSKKSKDPPSKDEVQEEIKQLNNSHLTDKQKLFCIYQTKYFNATKAYQKAYSCSYDVANAEGYKLLVNPCIKAEIERLKNAKLNRAMISEDDIFQKMIDIAFADITDYLSFGQEEVPVMTMFGPLVVEDKKTGEKKEITKIVNTVRFKESIEVDGTIISEVKQGKDGASIKMQDKMKALQWLADRMDLLPIHIKEKLELEKSKVPAPKETSESGIAYLPDVDMETYDKEKEEFIKSIGSDANEA